MSQVEIEIVALPKHVSASQNETIEEDVLRTSSPEIETAMVEQSLDTRASLELDQSNTADAVQYPEGVKFNLTMLALGLALFLVGLDNGIIATAIPSITNHFHTIADVGWYFAGYRLTACSFQFMFGKMYTVLPVKYLFLASIGFFELGSLLCGLAPTSQALVVGRAVSGFGVSGVISGVFTIVAQSVPLRRRPVIGGVMGTIEGIALSSAPLLGGVITDSIGWRWCFYINLPIGVLAVIVIALFFTNPQNNSELRSLPLLEKAKKVDLLSTVVFFPSITALLLAIQWGGTTYGWGNARIVVLMGLSALLLGVFLWLQWYRQDGATLPPRIIMNRSILAGMLFTCCNNSAFSIVEYYMPIYFQGVREMSASRSGVLTLPMAIGFIVFLLLGGSLTSAVGYYTPFMLLTSILSPISAGLLTTLAVDATLTRLILYQAMLGIACGIGFQSPQVAAQTVLTPSDSPMGIAAILFAQGFGPAVFVAAAQSVFTQRLTTDLGIYAPGLNATALETMGLADLKTHLGAKNLQGALLGYDKAITQTFYLSVALTCLTLVGSVSMEWRSVKQKTS